MLAPIIICVIVGLIAPTFIHWFFRGLTIIGGIMVIVFLYLAVSIGACTFLAEFFK